MFSLSVDSHNPMTPSEKQQTVHLSPSTVQKQCFLALLGSAGVQMVVLHTVPGTEEAGGR